MFRPAFKPDPFPTSAETGQSADEIEPSLKMAERPDWTLFRTVEGLAQKAGVPPKALRKLPVFAGINLLEAEQIIADILQREIEDIVDSTATATARHVLSDLATDLDLNIWL